MRLIIYLAKEAGHTFFATLACIIILTCVFGIVAVIGYSVIQLVEWIFT